MSSIREADLQAELRGAMKRRATLEVGVLRGLLAAIRNARIEKRISADQELAESDVFQILRREIKQRDEAIGFAETGGRVELVEKNRAEREVLGRFLPKAPSTEAVEQAVGRLYASGVTQMGAIMSALRQEFGPSLDGRTAAEIVKRFLSETEGA